MNRLLMLVKTPLMKSESEKKKNSSYQLS